MSRMKSKAERKVHPGFDQDASSRPIHDFNLIKMSFSIVFVRIRPTSSAITSLGRLLLHHIAGT